MRVYIFNGKTYSAEELVSLIEDAKRSNNGVLFKTANRKRILEDYRKLSTAGKEPLIFQHDGDSYIITKSTVTCYRN